jgi:nucleoside-diphosphate-sugar epimerase
MACLIILGCGYVGRALAAAAQLRGMEVHALTRNRATAAGLLRAGIHAVEGDIAGHAWHPRLPAGADLLVNCVASGGRDLDGYRHTYVCGQQSLVAFARQAAPRCIVYTGSTTVYPQTGGVEVAEDDVPAEVSPAAALLLQAEATLLAAALPARTFVLRLAGIYGPGRHRLLDQVRSGEPLAGTGAQYLNLVHRDDVVAAILAAADSGCTGGVFNTCDGSPAPKREVVGWLAARMGLPPPVFNPHLQPARAARRRTAAGLPDRRVSNTRARQTLGWAPAFPSFREGYEAIIAGC